ncbi:hypothetical protein MLD38_012145 [Melastoma candidum]|uniref:Uncharacterized protein n=1 Tax=Melastoma candidum TaxID=119954 RepID=A0ACB9R5F4_9MYRT|nr:hypothetical protein MLD38_012145 [Melastoma candidum]
MDVVVGFTLDGSSAGVSLISGSVRLTEELIWDLGSRDHLPVHDREIGSDLFVFCRGRVSAAVVKVQHSRREVLRVPFSVIQGQAGVCKDLRHRHPWGRVPIPERQGKARVAQKFPEDLFMKVEVVAVEREEQPRGMDLELQVREPDLIIGSITVRAVHIGLLHEAAWIILRQRLHELDCLVVLVDVVRWRQLCSRPYPQRVERRGLEVDDLGGRRRAAVGRRHAGRHLRCAALVYVRSGDRGSQG